MVDISVEDMRVLAQVSILALAIGTALGLLHHRCPALVKRAKPVAQRIKKLGSQKATASSTEKHEEKLGPLESCIVTSRLEGKKVVLVVDSNNVRGKNDFQWTNRDLLLLLQQWKETKYPGVEIVYAIDHGCEAQAFPYSFGLLVFAGPHRTADDVIASATRYLVISRNATTSNADQDEIDSPRHVNPGGEHDTNVFVVTSDGELRNRCLRANRPGDMKKRQRAKDCVKVFGSNAFVKCLESMTVEAETYTTQGAEINENKCHQKLTQTEHRIAEIEDDLRRFGRSLPPWQDRQAKEDALQHGPWRTTVLESTIKGASWPLDSRSFNEKTWHRVLVAENLRRLMIDGDQTKNDNGLLGEYQAHFNSAATEPADTMFEDHRIRHEPLLQKELFHYLNSSIHSTSNTIPSSANSTGIEENPCISSPAETCAAFLRKMVEESPGKTQEGILNRYMREAPSYMQFSRKADLLSLLQLIAIREQREMGQKARWYVLPNSNVDNWVLPRRRGRRVKSRKGKGTVDGSLVEMGKLAESQWFDLLKWQ